MIIQKPADDYLLGTTWLPDLYKKLEKPLRRLLKKTELNPELTKEINKEASQKFKELMASL
jgi:hypothetical protein